LVATRLRITAETILQRDAEALIREHKSRNHLYKVLDTACCKIVSAVILNLVATKFIKLIMIKYWHNINYVKYFDTSRCKIVSAVILNLVATKFINYNAWVITQAGPFDKTSTIKPAKPSEPVKNLIRSKNIQDKGMEYVTVAPAAIVA